MRHSPHLRFYDMCTYVHHCPRMSYKREYRPSQVMCPVLSHGQWVDLDAVAPLLDANKCVWRQRLCSYYLVCLNKRARALDRDSELS